MVCGRCGSPIGNRVIRYNGVVLCENCARELGVDEAIRSQSTLFGQAFPMFEEMANSILGTEGTLEFANTKIRCPRCKMTLREFETSGQAGCIECFNTFNETILKNLLKRQGSSEYKGRKPGEVISFEVDASEIAPAETSESSDVTIDSGKEAVNTAAPEKKEESSKASEKLDLNSFNCESLDSFSDKELETGMKMAAAAENYPLAMRLRDELKKRKEGN